LADDSRGAAAGTVLTRASTGSADEGRQYDDAIARGRVTVDYRRIRFYGARLCQLFPLGEAGADRRSRKENDLCNAGPSSRDEYRRVPLGTLNPWRDQTNTSSYDLKAADRSETWRSRSGDLD